MKKILFPHLIALICMTMFLPSCSRYASEKSLDCISLNMSKDEVIQRMKVQGVARGAILNKYGQSIEVREYKVQKSKTGDQVIAGLTFTALTLGLGAPLLLMGGEVNTYWLYFYNGRLVRWGQAGDWAEAERIIYDVNFNISYS